MSKVKLEMSSPLHVGNEEDAGYATGASRTLTVDRAMWSKVIALAEVRGCRMSEKHLSASQTATLVGAISTAGGDEQGKGHVSRHSHLTPASQLGEYFAIPVNRQSLSRITRLLQSGGQLDVTDV